MAVEAQDIKLLITAKTYPTLSNNYNETVCTAGITNNGSLIRIYPINYRELSKEQKFKKYQWVSCKVIKDIRDPRIDSYKLCSNIRPLNIISTKNNWQERRGLILNNVVYNLKEIIAQAYNSEKKSLFMFKPARIIKFMVIKTDNLDTLQIVNRKREILLYRFDPSASLVDDLPYEFYYKFMDETGKISNLQIIDWEIYQLTRKLMKIYKNNYESITQYLHKQYFDNLAKRRDVYFLLGTNRYWHIRRSKNPFMIIGVFYPPYT